MRRRRLQDGHAAPSPALGFAFAFCLGQHHNVRVVPPCVHAPLMSNTTTPIHSLLAGPQLLRYLAWWALLLAASGAANKAHVSRLGAGRGGPSSLEHTHKHTQQQHQHQDGSLHDDLFGPGPTLLEGDWECILRRGCSERGGP